MNMLKLFGVTALSILLFYTESIYSFSVPKLQGGTQSMSAFQNKRLMIVTLPCQQTASADSFLLSLDLLASNRISSLKVIAVPSIEDGYNSTSSSH